MNRKKNQIVARWSYAIIFLLSLLFVPALATPTSAAGTATVRLEPAAGNVDVGQTIDVNVVVADVTNLYAVEVHLTYDPNLLEVVDANPAMAGVQVGLGPFLAVDYTPQNQVDQGAGQIDFAYSQMAPSSPASGTGVIATITFRGKAAGTSALSFTSVILADQGAAAIPATPENGQLVVGTPPTATPVPPTPTPSGPTPTPTPTPTAVSGAILSFSPSAGSVDVGQTLQVVLRVQGASDLYGVEVHISHSSGIEATSITPGPCVADVVAQATVSAGQIDYAASLQAPSSPVNGDCSLATIAIKGVTPGTYSLHFSTALLSDPNGGPLTVTTYDGSVTVGGGATPPPPPSGCGNILGYHVVRPGETLYSIGRAYQVLPSAIASCNNIVNPSLIYVGTSLAIPNVPWYSIPPGPVAVRQFSGSTQPSCRFTHTVQWGETLFGISLQYGASMWAIAETNNIYNLHLIYAGQVLCIP